MKRLFAIMLVLCLILTMVPMTSSAAGVTSGTCGMGTTWNFDKATGTLTISGSGRMADYPHSASDEFLHPWLAYETDIKSIIIDNGVTYIGNYAFSDSTNLKSVSISNSVTEMGNAVFLNCTSLNNVVIPDSVTSIGGSMFKGCTSLASISLSKNLTEIPIRMFNACSSLTTVNLPTGITTIGSSAFEDCSSLSSITVPNGVTEIRQSAFEDCGELISVVLPASITYIDRGVFANCTKLIKVAFEGDAPQIQSDTFQSVIATAFYPRGNATWTDDVKQHYRGTISWIASDNPGQEEVDPYSGACGENTRWKFADGVLTISGSGTVDYVPWSPYRSQIKTVVIQDGVTNIYPESFYEAVNLTKITIPDSVTSIGAISFVGCKKLTGISIPDGVTEIGERAFEECTGLKKVVLPAGLEYIAWRTFYLCTGLTSVTLPENISLIGEGAFSGCSKLSSITIPAKVKTIEDYAFSNCTALRTIYFICNGPEVKGNFAFNKVNATIYYPANDPTWTDSVMAKFTFNSRITWSPYSACRYGHNLSEWEITKAATCTENGSKTRSCQREKCSHTETVKIEAPGHSLTSVVTAPTYTEKGYTTHTCTTCGHSYVDSYVDPLPLPEAEVAVARMILGNELAMQFAFPKDKIAEGVEYVVSATKTYADGRADKNILVPMDQWGTNGPYYYVSFNGIAAKEMGDTINVQILTADGVAVGGVYTDSVMDYAIRQLRKTTDAKTRTLYVDMLNYGAAAQTYFKYDAANLVTDELTPEEMAYGTESVKLENNLVKGTGYVASQLDLGSSILLRVKFNGIDASMYALVSFTSHTGAQKNVTIPGSEFISGGTVVVIDQVVAADYNQDVTITVYDADGKEVANAVESVASYLSRQLEKPNPLAIYDAVAKYCAAAYGYLHK